MTSSEREQREINRWQRERSRKKGNYYLIYLVFIITLIYSVDEIASQIGMLMKTEIAFDLFSRFGESSAGMLAILDVVVMPFAILGLLYRPLADKWGRKLFLVINTFGMSLALLIIYLSQSVIVYLVGACLVQFFIPHDMHVVYIMETTPKEHRAKIYSTIKFVATLGVMLIPLLRKLLMENVSEWREVYIIPALIGLVASFVALLLARETDAFIEGRLRYLSMSKEERDREKQEEKNAQGGLIPALKFAMRHKQLRWLYITSAIINVGLFASIYYETALSYGFAQGLYGKFTEDVMNAVSNGPVVNALFIFPVGCAFSQLIMGFISDKKGRKTAAIVLATNCLIGFLGFYLGSLFGLNEYLVGLFLGVFVGSYYSVNDVIIIMVGESSPTNLRSSTMSAQFIVTAIGGAISYAVGVPLMTLLGNQTVGILSFCLLVPGFILSLLTLWRFTGDTKGIDLETVEGTEWD